MPDATGEATSTTDGEPERTTWWPRDLEPTLAGEEDDEPGPAFLLRDDGQALFYPGRVNGLLAPSESGKTWLALLAVAQAARAGARVTIVDFEDTHKGVIGRLLLLGLTPEEIRTHIAYIGPDEPYHPFLSDTGRDLTEHLDTWQPKLVVLDGVNAAMTLQGLDLVSNKDATTFAQQILKPLTKNGAAVVYVDHTPKSKDNETAGGIGAQAKRAMTTGCAIRVEVRKAFGKGQDGTFTLRVDKDRQGDVRGASLPSQNGHWAGTAHLTSNADGTVEIVIESPQHRTEHVKDETFRPTQLMQRVSDFLASTPDGSSQRAITDGVRGKESYIRDALAVLVDEGHVERREVSGRGGTRLVHVLVKAYDQAADGASCDPFGSASRSASQCIPGGGSSASPRSASPSPPPTGRRRHFGRTRGTRPHPPKREVTPSRPGRTSATA